MSTSRLTQLQFLYKGALGLYKQGWIEWAPIMFGVHAVPFAMVAGILKYRSFAKNADIECLFREEQIVLRPHEAHNINSPVYKR